MKTKEELNALKAELEKLNARLNELTEEELKEVTGGVTPKKYDDEMFVMGIGEKIVGGPTTSE